MFSYKKTCEIEQRAQEKLAKLLTELTGSRISSEEALAKHLVNDASPKIQEGYVQVNPQEIRFAVDELGLVLKEIRRIYGK